MRTDHRLRCERCHAFMLTRTATLTPSSILCPACAALLPPVSAPAGARDASADASVPRSAPSLPEQTEHARVRREERRGRARRLEDAF